MLLGIVTDAIIGKILLALFVAVFFFVILYRVIYDAVLKAIRDSKNTIENKEHSDFDQDVNIH